MFITSILRIEFFYNIFVKHYSYIFKYLKSTFQIVKKSKVQFKYLQNALAKHNYINLIFETNVNNN